MDRVDDNKTQNGATKRPELVAACFCENFLEQTRQKCSIISIVTRLTIHQKLIPHVTSKPNDAIIPQGIMLVVIVRSNSKKPSKCKLTVSSISPSGKRVNVKKRISEFNQYGQFIAFSGRVPVLAAEQGFHQYEININGKILTRTLLEVIHHSPDEETNLSKKKSPRRSRE